MEDPKIDLISIQVQKFFEKSKLSTTFDIVNLLRLFLSVASKESHSRLISLLTKDLNNQQKFIKVYSLLFHLVFLLRNGLLLGELWDGFLIGYLEFLVENFQIKHFQGILFQSFQLTYQFVNPSFIDKIFAFISQGSTNKQKMLGIIFADFLNSSVIRNPKNLEVYQKMLTDRKFDTLNSQFLLSNSLRLFIEKINMNAKLGRVNDFSTMTNSLEGNVIWTILGHSSMSSLTFETYSKVMKGKSYYLRDAAPLKKFYFEKSFDIINQQQDEKTIRLMFSELRGFSLYLTNEEILKAAESLHLLADKCNYIHSKQYVVEVMNILFSQKESEMSLLALMKATLDKLLTTNKYQILQYYLDNLSMNEKSDYQMKDYLESLQKESLLEDGVF